MPVKKTKTKSEKSKASTKDKAVKKISKKDLKKIVGGSFKVHARSMEEE